VRYQGSRGSALRFHSGQFRTGPPTACLQVCQELVAVIQVLPQLQCVVEAILEAGLEACLRSRKVVALVLQGQFELPGPSAQVLQVEQPPDLAEPGLGARLQS